MSKFFKKFKFHNINKVTPLVVKLLVIWCTFKRCFQINLLLSSTRLYIVGLVSALPNSSLHCHTHLCTAGLIFVTAKLTSTLPNPPLHCQTHICTFRHKSALPNSYLHYQTHLYSAKLTSALLDTNLYYQTHICTARLISALPNSPLHCQNHLCWSHLCTAWFENRFHQICINRMIWNTIQTQMWFSDPVWQPFCSESMFEINWLVSNGMQESFIRYKIRVFFNNS